MQLEQRRQAMLQLHLRDKQFHCSLMCAYIIKKFEGKSASQTPYTYSVKDYDNLPCLRPVKMGTVL